MTSLAHSGGRGERACAPSHWLPPGRAAEVSRSRHVGPLGGGFERAAGPRPWRRRRGAASGCCSGRSVLGLCSPQAALPQVAGGGGSSPVLVPSRCLPSGAGLAAPRPPHSVSPQFWGVSPGPLTLRTPRAGGSRSLLPLSPCRHWAGGSRSPHAVSPQVLGWRVAAAITWSVLLLPVCTAAFIVLSGLDPFHPVRWISSRCPPAFSWFGFHLFVFLGFFFFFPTLCCFGLSPR